MGVAESHICDAARPIRRYGSALSAIRPDHLAAFVIQALMKRNAAIDWNAIDDVIHGCANQAGEDNRNVAHKVALLAGPPEQAPGARLALTATEELAGWGGRHALCAMCIGLGHGIAPAIERC